VIVKVNIEDTSFNLKLVSLPKITIKTQPTKVNVKLPSVNINNFYVENPTYTYIQSSPSQEWIINHNLNKYPLVSVYTDGLLEMEGSILHINNNQFRVIFSAPVTGVVIYS